MAHQSLTKNRIPNIQADTSRESLEVSGVGLAIDEVEAALAPQRDLIEKAIIGYQAVHAVEQQSNRERLNAARADMEMIAGFGENVLLQAHDHWKQKRLNEEKLSIDQVVFHPANMQETNRLQALTVWSSYPDEHTMYDNRVQAPFLVLGHRSTTASTGVLLLMPARKNALDPKDNYVIQFSKGKWVRGLPRLGPTGSGTQEPRLFATTMKNEDFLRLEALMKDRLTKYASNSDSIQDIPKELRIAQDTKKWPTEVSEPITLGGKKGLQTTPLKRVMPEDLIDSYPIVDFDVPKHMLDLAIAFDKSAQLKTLIEKRQSEAYRTQNL